MYQDSIMEKNKNRSVQSSSKGIGTESKKNQDVSTNKFWPKSGRRREPPNPAAPKHDSRKPAQARRYTDKRPRSRGGGGASVITSTTFSGETDAGLEGNVEIGSVISNGNKKQSLNHLLNFHYGPRGENATGGRHGHVANSRWLSTQKHKYNKEQFLQANCQFIVNSSGNYISYLSNPDALVDWDLVEQIHVQVSEFPSCPICLYSPVAAKITRCGHVYCWSCVLHYLTLSEKSWHKCPICYEAVHKNDLKSAVAIPHKAYNIGEHIKFRLMRREKGSFTAIPVEENRIKRNVLLNWNEKKVDTVYSKLLLADPAEVLSIIDREKKELDAQLNDSENAPEICFIEQAISLLRERERITLNKIQDLPKNAPEQSQMYVPIKVHQFNCDNIVEDPFGEVQGNDESDAVQIEEKLEEIETVPEEKSDLDVSVNENVKNYYFYQAADGQHIYLHALNIRMLEHTYGSLEHCPLTLTGRILEKEGGSMTEELRKRLRCLQHLPVTCQFEVAEIQLGPPIVNKETMDIFKKQIEVRHKYRNRRARDEKRREKRIAEEENRLMGKYPEVHINFDSFHQFPECGTEEPTLITGDRSPPLIVSESSSLCSETPDAYNAGPSFAKMLSTSKPKESSWPTLSKARPEEPKPRLINVTGQRIQVAKELKQHPRRHSDSETEPEDYVPVPQYNKSFGDAIAKALEKSSIEDGNEDIPTRGKKKKKNKHKILFTTSVMYPEK